ncbi:MAG: isoprenylcysteine carboxylmethyltransferase family protein [Betaproteobacteria bacterium]|nr:isoprenylcysteine carboxylmethyltransferase family protein [Betaproteobacteria bacterium]
MEQSQGPDDSVLWIVSAGSYDYGLWTLVAVNSLVFIAFAFGFARPRTARDWRSFGAFSAFVVALFTEMYGFPLTLYFLSGWLQSRYPQLDLFSHEAGHLWQTVFGITGDPYFAWLHTASIVLVLASLILLAASWWVLYRARRHDRLATGGPYRLIRHPQYVAFITIMVAFLIQWPTLVTLVMFPILAYMYVRLAHREEHEVREQFGEEYARYAARTPAFFPRWSATRDQTRCAG